MPREAGLNPEFVARDHLGRSSSAGGVEGSHEAPDHAERKSSEAERSGGRKMGKGWSHEVP